jgi:hypothetical protein
MLAARQGSQEYLKIVEYKQNYPVVQEENRCLKVQILPSLHNYVHDSRQNL